MSEPLYFVTGNANKFREIRTIIPEIKQLKINLDEIQSLDAQVVIEHKLNQAAAHHTGELIVEDTSLSLNCLNELPGTFIKYFEEAIGLQGIGELAGHYDDQSALAQTVIGYRDAHGKNHFVTGLLKGRVVLPRGAGGFGWDDIFIPHGYDKTFSELGPDIKGKISMRRLAAEQLRTLLSTTAGPRDQI